MMSESLVIKWLRLFLVHTILNVFNVCNFKAPPHCSRLSRKTSLSDGPIVYSKGRGAGVVESTIELTSHPISIIIGFRCGRAPEAVQRIDLNKPLRGLRYLDVRPGRS